MAGLINSNILTNPKTPLARTTGAVAGTSQALTNASTPAGFGEYRDPFGNSFLPGEPGYPAQPVPDSGFGEYKDAQGNSFLPGEPGHPSYDAGAAADQAFASMPAAPSAAPIDWDAWANTPWDEKPRRVSLDITPQSPARSTQPASALPPVAVTSGDPTSYVHPDPTYAQKPSEPAPAVGSDIGSRELPGQGEDVGDLADLGNDADMRAIVDQIMSSTQMAEPNLDPWYDREWKRSAGDINRQAAGRGMYNSSDALRMLDQSRESLGADQAKEEADYAMKAFENDMSRYGLAGTLLGKVSDEDLKRWDLFHSHKETAQTLEEKRKQAELDNLFNAGQATSGMTMDAFKDMTDDDMKMFLQIVQAGPAPSTNKANLEAQASEKAKAAVALFYKLQSGGK